MSLPTPQSKGRRRIGSRMLIGATSALAIGLSPAGMAAAAPAPTVSATNPDFGPNVIVFDTSMPLADIQARLDAINAEMIDAEMGTKRYAVFFKPGTYGTDATPLQFKVGYYTEVAGLGDQPSDVQINGKVEVYNRCLENGGTSNCLALVNFWRTLSNLTVNINGAGQDGCRASSNFYAVSQASPMRRVVFNGGNLSLMDYCTAGPQWASGGFLADSKGGVIINGSQQQWITRNSEVGVWTNAVWNQVFAGVIGAPDDSTFPNPPYTTLETNPLSREKPFIYLDDAGAYQVRVPSAQTDSRGVTWEAGLTAGRTIPITDFFIAKPSDSVQVINNALAKGQHLILTPGVYDIAKTISVKHADTVVIGLGHATLTAVGGAVPLEVADVQGVIIAGVTIDAGTVNSPALLRVGTKNGNNGQNSSSPTNPTTLSDVFFRVGGPHIGKADVSLEVNSNNVLIDHTWVWRADHGIEGFTAGVKGDTDRWNTNTAANGAIINGDNVTATGLFVEHYQEHNLIWNGENGRVIFFQNELPYDPPTQADWMQPDGTLGWEAYKVADHVQTHELWGGGVYVFNQNNPSIITENGFSVPETPGVKLHHIMTVNLSAGTIRHVVNGVGTQADNSNTGQPQFIVEYPLP